MHIKELKTIALQLSNQCWCRCWFNFDCRKENVRMAIQCLEATETGWEPIQVRELEQLGFAPLDDNKLGHKWLYTIPRTNEDGTPYISELF